jgi:hypothetical protein
VTNMKFGQMSIQKISKEADYLQLDICGHTPEEAVKRYEGYQTKLPIVLHGDWTKKGFSENNIQARLNEYVEIMNRLKEKTTVLGFTMHPTFRNKVSFDDFYRYCRELEERTGMEVWIENRSNSRIWLSKPEEIIEFSKQHTMTIDIPQLYISCGYCNEFLIETLLEIHWKNVREMHMANVKRTEKNTFVARKLNDGDIELESFFLLFIDVPHWTFEILGGVPTFESQVELMKEWKKSKEGRTKLNE